MGPEVLLCSSAAEHNLTTVTVAQPPVQREDASKLLQVFIYMLPNATFSQVLDEVQRRARMNEHVIATLRALNTLRNRSFGHGMAVPFTLTAAEVDFVYMTCFGAILLFVKH
jgi:hypothetical protein